MNPEMQAAGFTNIGLTCYLSPAAMTALLGQMGYKGTVTYARFTGWRENIPGKGALYECVVKDEEQLGSEPAKLVVWIDDDTNGFMLDFIQQ